MKLHGKVVVITGASRGIGRALALELGKSGCRLLLTAIEKDELTAFTEHLKTRLGVSVSSMAADLIEDSESQSFINWLKTQSEPPDILINNAGGGYFGRFASSNWKRSQFAKQLSGVHPETTPCHSERSEESQRTQYDEILRRSSPQNDRPKSGFRMDTS